jgi:hypothetical protein
MGALHTAWVALAVKNTCRGCAAAGQPTPGSTQQVAACWKAVPHTAFGGGLHGRGGRGGVSQGQLAVVLSVQATGRLVLIDGVVATQTQEGCCAAQHCLCAWPHAHCYQVAACVCAFLPGQCPAWLGCHRTSQGPRCCVCAQPAALANSISAGARPCCRGEPSRVCGYARSDATGHDTWPGRGKAGRASGVAARAASVLWLRTCHGAATALTCCCTAWERQPAYVLWLRLSCPRLGRISGCPCRRKRGATCS